MSKIYGYCRVSTKSQKIERQIDNIKSIYPKAIIMEESYSGTRIDGRQVFNRLLKKVKDGDTIVFDSISRMSRNSEQGFHLYEELYSKGVNLVFLKEPHINTDTYKSTLKKQIELQGNEVDIILEAINKYLMLLAKKQIQIAFDQSEKEVIDLRQRTKEGIAKAREKGKQIGQKQGVRLITKKSIDAKEKIKKYNKSFLGVLTNEETWKLIGISKKTFYKYKKEILDEMKSN